jgi:hypothetical protein
MVVDDVLLLLQLNRLVLLLRLNILLWLWGPNSLL